MRRSQEFKGAVDCFRKTVAKDGFLGLYAGMSAPLVAVTPIFAIYFWGFDKGKDIAAWAEGVPKQNISVGGIVFAGGFSAIVTVAQRMRGSTPCCIAIVPDV